MPLTRVRGGESTWSRSLRKTIGVSSALTATRTRLISVLLRRPSHDERPPLTCTATHRCISAGYAIRALRLTETVVALVAALDEPEWQVAIYHGYGAL